MSNVVVATIEIDAPLRDVWDFAMDPHSTTEWVTIVRKVGHVDAGPMQQGFRMDQTLCLRHVSFQVHWTLVEVDPPHFARWEGKGPARSRAIIEDRLSETGSGLTRFDYRNEFKTPFGALGAAASKALVGGVPEREAHASLERLKEELERRHAGRSASTATR